MWLVIHNLWCVLSNSNYSSIDSLSIEVNFALLIYKISKILTEMQRCVVCLVVGAGPLSFVERLSLSRRVLLNCTLLHI